MTELLGWVWVLLCALGFVVVVLAAILLKRFHRLVLRLEPMTAGVHEVTLGNRRLLQAARMIASNRVGEPAPST